MEGEKSYPQRLGERAEQVLEEADPGAVLVADALVANTAALNRIAAALESNED